MVTMKVLNSYNTWRMAVVPALVGTAAEDTNDDISRRQKP